MKAQLASACVLATQAQTQRARVRTYRHRHKSKQPARDETSVLRSPSCAHALTSPLVCWVCGCACRRLPQGRCQSASPYQHPPHSHLYPPSSLTQQRQQSQLPALPHVQDRGTQQPLLQSREAFQPCMQDRVTYQLQQGMCTH